MLEEFLDSQMRSKTSIITKKEEYSPPRLKKKKIIKEVTRVFCLELFVELETKL